MHRTYKRIVENADTAVLFIHGIVSTPNNFRHFLPLIPGHISVCNLLLDGHGKGVKDFAKTSMKTWEAQVTATVDALAQTHRKIIIVGHSMGTLLAIEQAVRCDKVKALLLLAVPIIVRVRMKNWVVTSRIIWNRIRPNNPADVAAKECCGVDLNKNLLLYISWIPRFLELLRKVKKTRELLPQLNTPCTAIQSMEDELVSARSVRYLRQHSGMKVYPLEHATHYYYPQQELDFLHDLFKKVVNV